MPPCGKTLLRAPCTKPGSEVWLGEELQSGKSSRGDHCLYIFQKKQLTTIHILRCHNNDKRRTLTVRTEREITKTRSRSVLSSFRAAPRLWSLRRLARVLLIHSSIPPASLMGREVSDVSR